jgi:hypothetical protein
VTPSTEIRQMPLEELLPSPDNVLSGLASPTFLSGRRKYKLKQFMKENRMVHKIALKLYNLMIRKENLQDGSVAGCGKGEIVKKKNTNTLISKEGRVAEFELASALQWISGPERQHKSQFSAVLDTRAKFHNPLIHIGVGNVAHLRSFM